MSEKQTGTAARLPRVARPVAACADLDTVQAALARLSARARASGTPWALGLLARGGALLTRGEDAEALYQEALDHLGRSGVSTELARARNRRWTSTDAVIESLVECSARTWAR